MYLFNSFSDRKEEVDLSQKIGLYVCGITPYDTTHLGHAFTFLAYDVLVRYLRFLQADVTYVQNVTDIDDDILIKARSLGIPWKILGEREIQKHLKNMDALNALRSDFYPKATEHITAMIRIIEVLIKKGLAYVKNGNVLGPRSREQRPHGSVYFEVKKDKNFGKLSKLGYRAQLEIANDRGNFPLDPDKRDPLDFILWQKNKPGEPSWSSPWGNGRPGWHIECSSMSMKYLGPTITVHGGGEDLIFPHHEAEIAQSETATGKKFVKIWMHTGMVYSDGKKMSKSLGNMIFVNDLLKKYSPNVIRFYLLLHHYRLAWNYDEKDLQEAEKKIIILEKVAQSQAQLDVTKVQKLLPAFFKALDDNLDIPRAIKILINLTKSKTPGSGELIFQCGRILGLAL
ncbi:cysteine--tRNA ligase [Candidatus Curtissbacteria bacterium RIFCSPHIGHO2_01_FULL_41_44]|uniref:Cysteine--tRNA ligase n=1 Tax=Candidatus Curtissbacteria bacterium RIFCSPLOWO2_01_FULL_42_50 TaxID=1797730 RepID=A0A1F5H3W7_9BACT|nr:MAG: cysteine--tRNA ligase [Candidatus Curtissbacteria bacterium RIFCSPHIGHO2_01_FULL_41_44]OGD94636.1 MAG: cysteine--tRNA ligase [Candidatus Curtissbacteria bacterium RIFCSPHIGHO2_02_FULL_42_58]OGD96949.1 MAG: cysteine--tRNA ligase [Candidatus Curtissbacteria bacterium RIFCSPHIGHO2_12_FULL_42_33]OGD98801.1 MAG: cysteine--tRNA ligase [Candidatus Curtissbacteria bacterium RIFCSPLOWO2_01_FULL_42_50]OGE02221.1 MAG: cysteine--tRNA ligase [Candidatus Curtissbacteria bacterium RIFCSPLOWO2_12_FULL_